MAQRQGKKTPKMADEMRRKIAMDYMASGMTLQQTADKYGLPNMQVVSLWVKKFGLREKIASLPDELTLTDMTKKHGEAKLTDEEAVERIRQLEAELGVAKLQILALNTMIDIAEEQGYPIRKKSGAKQ